MHDSRPGRRPLVRAIALAAQMLLAQMLLVLALSTAPASAATDFSTWITELRHEAAGAGISPATLDTALADVKLLPRVLELDQRQPENTITFAQYLRGVANTKRVAQGRKLLAQHRALLDPISRRYGVQPRFIVALWGIETNFGQGTGGFRVVDALATLAFEGRRSAYFRKELLDALRILDQGHIGVAQMRGSWAGAMGQTQFMPSSFLKFAVDFNGDGRRDIWTTQADVFASAANYLSTVGWNGGQTWGRQVKLPPGFNAALANLDTRKPLAEWHDLGIRRTDGGALPRTDLTASLVLPDGPAGMAFLVYDNYRTLKHWNRSTFFATTVGILADRIGGAEEPR